jgi:hypothetical protein
MSRCATPMRLLCTTGLVALLGMAPGAGTGFAQSVNDMVRTLNNIVNPSDAQRLEDQARRNDRPQEEQYWHDYRAGSTSPDRNRRDYGRDGERPDYRQQGDYATNATRVFKAIADIDPIAIPTIGVEP